MKEKILIVIAILSPILAFCGSFVINFVLSLNGENQINSKVTYLVWGVGILASLILTKSNINKQLKVILLIWTFVPLLLSILFGLAILAYVVLVFR
jgi:hypothetical protein